MSMKSPTIRLEGPNIFVCSRMDRGLARFNKNEGVSCGEVIYLEAPLCVGAYKLLLSLLPSRVNWTSAQRIGVPSAVVLYDGGAESGAWRAMSGASLVPCSSSVGARLKLARADELVLARLELARLELARAGELVLARLELP